jgi:hypothetical protein
VPRRRRRSPIVGSPAASLLPQIEEQMSARRGRFRRRVVDADLPEDSPGKLYTLVSAGSLELPDDERERRRWVRRSPRLAIALAAALAVVWLVFR